MTGIFTLDSILALMIASGMIVASVYLVSIPKISPDEYLYQFSLDVLTVAEKNNALEKAVNRDPSGIDTLKLALPDSICFKLEVINETGSLVFYSDTKCGEPEKYVISKRTFVSDSKFYISRLKVWHK